MARFTDVLGSAQLAALDLAANVDELGGFVAEKIEDDMAEYGVEVLQLLVENVSLPPAVEEALDQRTSMGVIGDLGAYTQYQTAQAIGTAAANPGGGAAAAGVGLGAGLAMANQMGAAMTGGAAAPAPPASGPPSAPPPPPDAGFHVSQSGQSAGPFGLDVLRQQTEAGDLTPDTFVWSESLGEWKKAGEVEALRPLFPATPPPPPDA